MRALVQRVSQARVDIEGACSGRIGQGLLVFLGVGDKDGKDQADRLWAKISKLRVFADEAGKTNLSVGDVGGGILVVSQFTLFADCRRGNRPSFTDAAAPGPAEELYDYFCGLVRAQTGDVQAGRFGADMQVSLVNDGPFTIWLDTEDL